MVILKSGYSNQPQFYFACHKCGFIGKATKDECDVTWVADAKFYHINCPCCKSTLYNIEDKEEIKRIQELEVSK